MSAHSHWGHDFIKEVTRWNALSRKLMRGEILTDEDAKPLVSAAIQQGGFDAMSGDYEEVGDTDFMEKLAASETKLISCCVSAADGSQEQEFSSRRVCLLIREGYINGWERRPSAPPAA